MQRRGEKEDKNPQKSQKKKKKKKKKEMWYLLRQQNANSKQLRTKSKPSMNDLESSAESTTTLVSCDQ
jgi:hypothetical protein